MTKNPIPLQRFDVLCLLQDEESQEKAKSALSQVEELDFFIYKAGITDALTIFKTVPSPGILIMDCSDSELPITDFEELRQLCEPDMKIIAIGDRHDVGLFRDLLHLNISDYLVKPFSVDLLARSLAFALGKATKRTRSGKLVTFLGTRGGVGTTTIATNAAAILANERGKKVVLVDMDLQMGNVSLKLDMGPTHALREVLDNPERLDNLFIDRSLSLYGNRLKIMSAEESLEETFIYQNETFLDSLDKCLQILCTKFHYVFIDCPRYPTDLWQFLNLKSDQIVLVSENNLSCLREASRILQVLSRNKPIKNEVLLMNKNGMIDGNTMQIDEFGQTIQRKIECVVPFEGLLAHHAANLGQPLYLESPNFEISIQHLLDIISGEHVSKKHLTKNKSFIDYNNSQGILKKIWALLTQK